MTFQKDFGFTCNQEKSDSKEIGTYTVAIMLLIIFLSTLFCPYLSRKLITILLFIKKPLFHSKNWKIRSGICCLKELSGPPSTCFACRRPGFKFGNMVNCYLTLKSVIDPEYLWDTAIQGWDNLAIYFIKLFMKHSYLICGDMFSEYSFYWEFWKR